MTKQPIVQVKPPKPISKMTDEERSDFVDALFDRIKKKMMIKGR